MTIRDEAVRDGPDLADLQEQIARLRRDLADLGATVRGLATREWSGVGENLRSAADGYRRDIADRISKDPERAMGIALLVGLTTGLILRARCDRSGP